MIFLGDFSILIFLGVSSNSNCSSFFVIFVGFETSFLTDFLDGFISSSSSTELSFYKVLMLVLENESVTVFTKVSLGDLFFWILEIIKKERNIGIKLIVSMLIS